jgi:hypothetical protein
MEDRIELDPSEAYSPIEEENGTVTYVTGDPLIDSIEKQIAEGKDPTADFGPEVTAWLKKSKKKNAKTASPTPAPPPPDDGMPPDEVDTYKGGKRG